MLIFSQRGCSKRCNVSYHAWWTLKICISSYHLVLLLFQEPQFGKHCHRIVRLNKSLSILFGGDADYHRLILSLNMNLFLYSSISLSNRRMGTLKDEWCSNWSQWFLKQLIYSEFNLNNVVQFSGTLRRVLASHMNVNDLNYFGKGHFYSSFL